MIYGDEKGKHDINFGYPDDDGRVFDMEPQPDRIEGDGAALYVLLGVASAFIGAILYRIFEGIEW